jgi:putative ABC transport system permease protein
MHLINIALNNLRRRKLKMFSVLIGIVIGIGAMVALSSVVTAIDKELADKFDQIGSNIVIVPKTQDLTVSYGSVAISSVIKAENLSSDAVERIFQIEESNTIAVVAPKLLGSADISVNGLSRKSTMVMGVEWQQEMRLKDWWEIEGKDWDQAGSIVLGNLLAEKMDAKIGDIIEINDNSYHVSGILKKLGTIEDEMLLMTLSASQDALHMNGKLSMIEVAALCYTCPIDVIVEQISNNLPEARVSAVKETIEARKMVIDRFSSVARMVLIIVLLISVLIIMNKIMSSVSERTGEIGILRAIGFRKIHIAAIIMMETIIISIIGGITGYLLGMAAASFASPIIANMEVSIQWGYKLLLQAIAMAVVLGIVSGIWPTIRASRQDPALALRYF